jgi:hypothetical protein
MKQILVLILVVVSGSTVFGQSTAKENAELIIKYYKECDCKELSVISGSYIKDYSSSWLTNMMVVDDYLVLEKNGRKHRWRFDNIPFIENAPGSLNVFLAVHVR